jgi:hypothetical protein
MKSTTIFFSIFKAHMVGSKLSKVKKIFKNTHFDIFAFL